MTFLEALALAKRDEFLISPSGTSHRVLFYYGAFASYHVVDKLDDVSVRDLLGEWDVAALKSVSREKGTET